MSPNRAEGCKGPKEVYCSLDILLPKIYYITFSGGG